MIKITDITPVNQSELNDFKQYEFIGLGKNSRISFINFELFDTGDTKDKCNIPPEDEFINSTKDDILQWNTRI